MRREARRILGQYTAPLCLAADTLESRLNNLIRNMDKNWWQTDQYYRLSTLFVFCQYLGWVRNIERRMGYIGFASDISTRELNNRLRMVWGALSSITRFFYRRKDINAVANSALPQLLLRAAGDLMIPPKTTDGEAAAPVEFAKFVIRYGNDAAFRHWIGLIEPFFHAASQDLQWNRIILTQLGLVRLIDFLDPKHVHTRRRAPRNVDKIRDINLGALAGKRYFLECQRKTKLK